MVKAQCGYSGTSARLSTLLSWVQLRANLKVEMSALFANGVPRPRSSAAYNVLNAAKGTKHLKAFRMLIRLYLSIKLS